MDNRWADIVALSSPPPDETALWWWGLLVLLVMLAGLIYRQRPRVAMRRRLRRLQRELAREQIEGKTAGFMIADCLRRAYGTSRLDRLDFAEHQRLWQQFVHRLQQQQYQPDLSSRDALQGLLQEAQKWLRQ